MNAVGERLGNGLQSLGIASKVTDINSSFNEIVITCNDAKLSTNSKGVKCTAEGAFICSRVAEITTNQCDNRSKAVLNCVATVTDVGRKIVDGVIKEEHNLTTLKKVTISTVAGLSECMTNLAIFSENTPLALIGTTISLSIGILKIVRII